MARRLEQVLSFRLINPIPGRTNTTMSSCTIRWWSTFRAIAPRSYLRITAAQFFLPLRKIATPLIKSASVKASESPSTRLLLR
jgi:hypothetical protein